MQLKKMRRMSLLVSLISLIFCLGGGTVVFAQDAIIEVLSQYTVVVEDDIDDGCTVIAVGKDATADGSVITYMTADTQGAETVWYYEPPANYPEGATRKIYIVRQTQTFAPLYNRPIDEESTFSGVEIPQVAHTNGFMHSLHMHINDKQVQMNESTIGGQRALRNPNAIMDICNMEIIGMERASTAREAIQIMGALAEEWGYGQTDSGECLAVADKNEAWIFEVFGVGPLWVPGVSEGSGAVWVAQRVPDDSLAVVDNHSIIGEVDFDDAENFMYSSNLVDVAVEFGWYDPASGEPFDVSNAYDPRFWSNGEPITPLNSRGYYGRQWRVQSLVAPSLGLSVNTPMNDLPFCVKPEAKLSLQDIFEIDRDHYEGSEIDMVNEFAAGPFGNPNRYPRSARIDMDGDGTDERYYFGRPLQPFHTEYTSLCQSRAWLPDEIGGILWLGPGEADSTCFMPFYCGITEMPESFTIGNHWEFDRDAARWAFDYVDYVMLPFYQVTLPYVEAAQARYESRAIAEVAVVDEFALKLYEQNTTKAQAYLTDFCVQNANQVVDAWWTLGDTLVMYFAHGYDYTIPGRKGSLSAPEWYLRGIIELDELAPAPQ